MWSGVVIASESKNSAFLEGEGPGMPPYSFGARWVGIVAFREPLPPEPLHRMAIRLHSHHHQRPVRIASDLTLAVGVVLPMPAGIRRRCEALGLSARSVECLVAERALRAGGRVHRKLSNDQNLWMVFGGVT